jgi:hypothetical protein
MSANIIFLSLYRDLVNKNGFLRFEVVASIIIVDMGSYEQTQTNYGFASVPSVLFSRTISLSRSLA